MPQHGYFLRAQPVPVHVVTGHATLYPRPVRMERKAKHAVHRHSPGVYRRDPGRGHDGATLTRVLDQVLQESSLTGSRLARDIHVFFSFFYNPKRLSHFGGQIFVSHTLSIKDFTKEPQDFLVTALQFQQGLIFNPDAFKLLHI